jgi:leucyl-tRNA synthetase
MKSEQQQNDYDFAEIEPRWQKYWQRDQTFKAIFDPSKPKFYCLDMFPYPSGQGLHVGHPEGYTATDIVSRYKRMNGFNVLHPMGWDAFGLPAEQYAIKTGTHPKETTAANVARFRKQLQMIGFSYDWDREINTTDEKYYKWTQWIFLKLYERGLAYQSHEPVNWCPALGTVLANEEVIDGKSERGGHPVIKRPMRQWVLRITEYADRLLEDLEDLDWPEHVKEMQRNWIGKKSGAHIDFTLEDPADQSFRVFTTRPDTLFGATFCVFAPEHPLVPLVTTEAQKQPITEYVEQTLKKSDMERSALAKDKTGVPTGGYAINPANGERLPIFIADYVLMHYGHGAIMAVPGHDDRDHAFALKYELPIKRVLQGGDEPDITKKAHCGDGVLVDSDFLDGLKRTEAITRMMKWLHETSVGKEATSYKLRDWIFSRQRYWGEPFPLARNEEGDLIGIDESDLPVVLPEIDDFKPSGSGESPLAKATDWLTFEIDGVRYQRETNTMPQWAGSCWYYLRFIDPDNMIEPWNPEKEAYWMPVDLYIGGAEHAVLHLLYARFWHKVLYDLGYVSSKEPFTKLVNQGMILGENGEKMAKSRGNVVNPDEIIQKWGADSLRLYEMFMGPIEATKPWQTNGIYGVHRFLKRFWKLAIAEDGHLTGAVQAEIDSDSFLHQLHRTIKKVTADIESLQFNTAIAALMELLNVAYRETHITSGSLAKFVLLVSPFAPHFGEELWARLGHSGSLAYAPWPSYDSKLVTKKTVILSLQVNGKARGAMEVSVNTSKEAVLESALQQDGVKRHIAGKNIIREVYVPERIVNFVVD